MDEPTRVAGEQVVFSKLANGFFDDVTSSLGGVVVSGYRAVLGGLWVGGRVTLTTWALRFEPNAVNRAMHDNARGVAIPLRDVRDVQVHFGFLTRIVEVRTDSLLFRFRCYGAGRAAARIREACGLGR